MEYLRDITLEKPKTGERSFTPSPHLLTHRDGDLPKNTHLFLKQYVLIVTLSTILYIYLSMPTMLIIYIVSPIHFYLYLFMHWFTLLTINLSIYDKHLRSL